MTTISLCMIVKNEEQNLAQCLASVRGCYDELIIVDTGSTDNTRAVAIAHGANLIQFDQRNHPEAFYTDDEQTCREFGAPGPYSGEVTLGDFAAARNESFAHATGDFVVWMDADDILEQPEKIREVVADMQARQIGIGFCAYNYAQDHLGRVFYRQWRERIFRRGDAKWVGPVHEVLIPTTKLPPVQYPFPTWSHKRKHDRAGTPNRNYKILLRQVLQIKQRDPLAAIDPRVLFYLGQEARFVEPQKAVGFYEEYLKTSGWPEERAAAHAAIGTMLEFGVFPKMKPEDAYAQANREYAASHAELPGNPDGLFGLARIAYLRGRFADCVRYTEQGLALGNVDSMLGANPIDRLYRPHVFYNHALANLGRLEDATKSCEAALAVMPDDPGVPGGHPGMLKNNLRIYREELAKRAAAPTAGAQQPTAVFDKDEDVDAPPSAAIPVDAMVIWSMQLWKQLVVADDLARARTLLDSLPAAVMRDPAFARMVASTIRRTGKPLEIAQPPQGDVVFYLGPAPEPWDPSTPSKQGLGGSETAAIEMARELVKLGRKVTVYAEASGVYDGVLYEHHSTFHGAKCKVFIASRAPWAIEVFGSVAADLKLLWVHDIHCGPASPQMERWLHRFDRVLCLSKWHAGFFASCYPTLHPDKIIVTRNGIDPGRFSKEVPKLNHMVFSSSPNRGLELLLANFREIRAHIPDAELHIYYGFDTWETMARAANNAPELAEIARYKALIAIAESRGGVFFHGRQPQPVLADAFLRAKVWGYLTTFPETSCISAMEAMAAGCLPICSRVAALGETVGERGVMIDNDSGDAPQTFVRECVRALGDTQYPMAKDARTYALAHLSWSAVAESWVALFDTLAQQLAENPLPPWRST